MNHKNEQFLPGSISVMERAKLKRVFLENLYKGILFRNADDLGMTVHLGDGDFDLGSANSILLSFINSEERKQFERSILEFPKIAIESTGIFSHIISIGGHCATAGTLKRFGLKRNSYPFDWLFSSLGMVAHCIVDNFDTFLDRKFHVSVPISERLHKDANFCHHLFYQQKFGLQYIFNHRDPTVYENYQYYRRCVERFVGVLASPAKCMLLALVQNTIDDRDVYTMDAALSPYPQISATIVKLVPKTRDRFGINKIAQLQKCEIYEFSAENRLGAVAFEDPIDELIFCNFLKGII